MVGFAFPTLKRGANNRCTYGAEDGWLGYTWMNRA
jgi:hypothetical protein